MVQVLELDAMVSGSGLGGGKPKSTHPNQRQESTSAI